VGDRGTWGPVEEEESLAALRRALDMGVNFFDTADVNGDGLSERLITRRRLDPHVASGYNRANLTDFVERSLRNLETEALDLLQLHCPPTAVYYMPEVFGVLDDRVAVGKLHYYCLSCENAASQPAGEISSASKNRIAPRKSGK